MKFVYTQKNWPYAYNNLKESLKELEPHLKRLNQDVPEPLAQYIDPKTTQKQLQGCIANLSEIKENISIDISFESKVTGMLLERFLTDAQYFQDNLIGEIQTMGTEDFYA